MNAYFYSEIIKTESNTSLLDFLSKFASENMKQVFVINKPLGTNYEYDYTDAAIVLIPRHKILVINYGSNEEEFNLYFDDLIEDIGYISDKYNYKGIIGRQRQWKDQIFKTLNISEIEDFSVLLKEAELVDPNNARISQLIISLLTGSINDILKVGKEVPVDVLDAVRRRIVLYDAKQTDFIFRKISKKTIRIQGLAGTGKTELLLRKLKELYTNNESKNCKIALTCFNKILAQNLKDRIPSFFDFLKVEEQIKWNETLFVMSSWGSNNIRYSGIYSYICLFYGLDFLPYSYDTSFDYVCQKAVKEIKYKGSYDFCFDYMLIDESQDFPPSFFELCELVTKKQVYIAGDIFQNIFDISDQRVDPDFLLNNCYRTDPKTLIFAHAIGMGLIDHTEPDKYISWLTDEEWSMCGYEFSRDNNRFTISRQPLNRFDDIDTSSIPSVIFSQENFSEFDVKIVEIIKELKEKYASITPDDIGIVFLENETENYRMIDRLASSIYSEFQWEINRGYVSKSKVEGKLFASNINNVKGLEFPFIICVSKNKFNRSLKIRNAMYMVLTRSFISSYFLVTSSNNDETISSINKNLDAIISSGSLTIAEPSESQKLEKRKMIISKNNINKSQREIAEEIMEKLYIPTPDRAKIHKALKALLEDENDVAAIKEAIENLIRIVQ